MKLTIYLSGENVIMRKKSSIYSLRLTEEHYSI